MEPGSDRLVRAYLDALTAHRRALAALRDTAPETPAHRDAAARVEQCWLELQAWQTALYGVLSVPRARER